MRHVTGLFYVPRIGDPRRFARYEVVLGSPSRFCLHRILHKATVPEHFH